MPSLSRLGARVPLFLAGEGAVTLPRTPPHTTVLPRDLRRAADLLDAVGGGGDRSSPQRSDAQDRNDSSGLAALSI